jgi:hypothetical protein
VDPLVDKFQSKKFKIKAEGFSQEKLMEMLDAIRLILPLNEQLRSDLKKRVDMWHAEETIGDVFTRLVGAEREGRLKKRFYRCYNYVAATIVNFIFFCRSTVGALSENLCRLRCKL